MSPCLTDGETEAQGGEVSPVSVTHSLIWGFFLTQLHTWRAGSTQGQGDEVARRQGSSLCKW